MTATQINDLQPDLDSLADQFVQIVLDRTPESSLGIFATWEACFRMAMKGQCEHEIAVEKLAKLLPFLT